VCSSDLPQKFVGVIHNESKKNIMKSYQVFDIYFRPSGFFNAKFKYRLSYGDYDITNSFNPNADYVGFAGEFDVFEKTLQGNPQLYTFQVFPEMRFCRGTAIQFEISNETLNGIIQFDGYRYEYSELHENRRPQSYAI
jgi:hypothetical protein